ncbi:hypothetical protein HBH98_189770 [Parastagonospora nodorum]|nr:hypothetical protein HBH47_000340 [Parastagonospora nodorum]KAH4340782.1 hypothetical protein HBH98_189770 [Parastagonospora nodorum]KAH4367351.1 hypothetical protein HBH97_157490 [Parastagonospora nodorum]KAH4386198.1 hypothetical protein HBH99_174590 [Parastagonospora nodorum]KAH4901499.1 hypothetical protein HBI80_141340 [Parastagonospora nodorum]
MATYLFPAGKHAKISSSVLHKPSAIPRHLFNIVRGGNDAIDALQLFLKLLRENEFDVNSPGYMAFDAHVGDTSCQLRACMLLEIFNRYRQHVSSTTEVRFIEQTIDHLKKVVDNAHTFCKEVCNMGVSKKGPAALGMSKQGMSIDEILRKIGWTEPKKPERTQEISNTALVVSVASSVASPSVSQASASRISVGSTNTSASDTASISQIDPIDLQEERANFPSVVYAEATSDYWEPWDWHQVVHFLVYSYVLSKYKHFTVRAQVYGANINPQSAFDCSNKLLDGNFPHPCQPPTKRPIELEFAALQSYLSDCSCAWLSSTSRVFSPDRQLMASLLEKSKRTSAKGVSSVSCYIGYLVLRELWAQTSPPVMIVSRRYCSHGFHKNIFRASICVLDVKHRQNMESVIRENISWDLTHVTGAELDDLRQSSRPHIVISGNSIDGETAEYMARLPTTRLHDDDTCEDNAQHCKDLLASDQDRNVLAIFADHRHYGFALSGEEEKQGEDAVVHSIMDEAAPGLSQQLQASKAEARELGTGPSLKLFMWQHVVLESPGRFLQLLDKHDRPIVVGAPVLKQELIGFR